MSSLATQFTQRTYQQPYRPTFLQKVASEDKLAVRECTDSYGNFIWALAKGFTNSIEEAEAASREIYTDIRRYAEPGDRAPTAADHLNSAIARRRLIRHLR